MDVGEQHNYLLSTTEAYQQDFNLTYNPRNELTTLGGLKEQYLNWDR